MISPTQKRYMAVNGMALVARPGRKVSSAYSVASDFPPGRGGAAGRRTLMRFAACCHPDSGARTLSLAANWIDSHEQIDS